MRDCRLPGARPLAALLFALSLAAPPAFAQAGLAHAEEARTVPKGLLQFRALVSWSRYDARFDPSGTRPLGATLSSDSLGTSQLSDLLDAESRIESASGSPFVLSLGRSRVDATAREEILPLTLEYGLTHRLAIGIMMPVIRKRVSVQFRLDTAGGFEANVGPNAHRTSTVALQNNATVQAEFAAAATQLQNRLAFCQANPAAAGCPALLTRQAEAQQLIQSSQTFAGDVGAVYGTASTPGMAFVPISQSAAQTSVALRISDFNSRYQDLLGTTSNVIQAVPRAAGGPAGVADVQRYLTEDLGRDSIATQERLGVGDVEVGIKAMLIDRRPTALRRLGLQLALATSLRIPTGSEQSPTELADLRTTDGRYWIDSRAIIDARFARLGLQASGRFAAALADSGASGSPAPLGRERSAQATELHVAPRWHVSEPFAIHGAFSWRSTDALGGDRLAGVGVSFSTLSSYSGRTPPVEMRFTHLEAISGDAGRPKFFRDQLELRYYYRLRKR